MGEQTGKSTADLIRENYDMACKLAGVDKIEIVGKDFEPPPNCAVSVLDDGTEIFVPLEGLVDVDKMNEARSQKIAKLSEQIARAEKKLANENFVTKAKPEVVQRERDNLASLQQQVQKLESNTL